jgi:hypothetical protein
VISKLFGHTTEKLARDVYADFSTDELAAKVHGHRTDSVRKELVTHTSRGDIDD